MKEPRLLASMSHPNIVTVLTAEKQDDVFFIVMEDVQGETLEHLVMRDGPLEVTWALDFSCQICNAVDHAHSAGVLHRDLRPGNMPLTAFFPSVDGIALCGLVPRQYSYARVDLEPGDRQRSYPVLRS